MDVFRVGEFVYFLVDTTINYGNIISINYDGDIPQSYNILRLQDKNQFTITPDEIAISAIPFFVPSVTPTNYPTNTPNPSSTRPVTPTPSSIYYSNTFPLECSSWNLNNSSCQIDDMNRLEFISSSNTSEVSATATLAVNPYSYYNLEIYYVGGTTRYAICNIESNGEQIYAISPNGSYENLVFNEKLSDSGKLSLSLYILNSDYITVKFTYYSDSSYSSYAQKDQNYFIKETKLIQISQNTSMTPYVTKQPIPTPSIGASIYDAVVLADNPSHYWSLNFGLNDNNGNYGLSLINSSLESDSFGNLINQDFYDYKGYYTKFPIDIDLYPTGSFEFWIIPSSLSNTFMDILYSSSSALCYEQDGNGVSYFSLYNANDYIQWENYQLEENNSYHIILTIDNGIPALYVNSIKLNIDTINSNNPPIITTDTVITYIGGDGISSENFIGFIGNISVYNQALTQMQISTHFNKGIQGYRYPVVAIPSPSPFPTPSITPSPSSAPHPSLINSRAYNAEQGVLSSNAGIAFSQDGTYLCIVYNDNTAPSFLTYKKNSSTGNYDQLSDANYMPTAFGTVYDSCFWAPDNSYLIISGSFGFTIYSMSSDHLTIAYPSTTTFTSDANIAVNSSLLSDGTKFVGCPSSNPTVNIGSITSNNFSLTSSSISISLSHIYTTQFYDTSHIIIGGEESVAGDGPLKMLSWNGSSWLESTLNILEANQSNQIISIRSMIMSSDRTKLYLLTQYNGVSGNSNKICYIIDISDINSCSVIQIITRNDISFSIYNSLTYITISSDEKYIVFGSSVYPGEEGQLIVLEKNINGSYIQATSSLSASGPIQFSTINPTLMIEGHMNFGVTIETV